MPAVSGRSTPLRDAIAEQVRDRIIRGELRPGDRLREEDLASYYRTSRLPVREALARLQAEGFLEVTKFKGASVAVPTLKAGLELVRVRQTLEGLAAELAAERRGGTCGEDLSDTVARAGELLQLESYADLPPLVDSYHALVAEASGNQQLVTLLEQLRVKVRWVFGANLAERAAECWADHEEILQAVLRGFPDLARELMTRHVAADAQAYRALDEQALRVDGAAAEPSLPARES